ncbi:NAD(P)-dependent alcohol dehydrogenase [Malacoplasma penetrans]|nr:NAD(P)-dependent alcohol dehydrogenase [Malacoplasma penetrans]RXY96515.1 NAD(P)-dependent alcohol dehydrogenase [Malacoplasma penetrans]
MIDITKRITTKGKALFSKDGKIEDFTFERRALNDDDILIKIKYCGICHSDIHHGRSEWGKANYPTVMGHEIVGEVVATGNKVSKFKVGDNAGIGCMVNSCGNCDSCKVSEEQYCNDMVVTYGGLDKFNNNEMTYGGYSNYYVVKESFAIKVPQNVPLEYIAPLFCAGITTYSPIVFSKVKKGDKVAIAGFGGLGVMAVKYAKFLGADVYVIARNNKKEEEAKKLGVKKLYPSVESVDEKFDLIISTIPTKYEVMDYVNLLKVGGELALLGLPPVEEGWSLYPGNLIFKGHRKVYGSIIGGIKATQEMLDFSIKHNIYPEIEVISADQINEAFEKMTTGKAKFRYVIDMSTLK